MIQHITSEDMDHTNINFLFEKADRYDQKNIKFPDCFTIYEWLDNGKYGLGSKDKLADLSQKVFKTYLPKSV